MEVYTSVTIKQLDVPKIKPKDWIFKNFSVQWTPGMRNWILIILCVLMVATTAGVNTAFAGDKAPEGITYTFTGGSWDKATSWNPNLPADGGPGDDDNVVIPVGYTAQMPDFCSIATLTVEGKILTGTEELRVNSMTISMGGSFKANSKIRCVGKFTNKGTFTSDIPLNLFVQKIENTGKIISEKKLNIMSMDGFTNSGEISASGILMIRCHEMDNTGNINSKTSNVAIFSNMEINNDGTIQAGNGKANSTGGDVLIACQTFTGTGSVTAGSGGDGNPPGKAGKTKIGTDFDNTSWTAENPSDPTGNISDKSTWDAQVSKNSARDGQLIVSKERLLTLDIPANSRPMRGKSGYSVICKTGGKTLTTKLHWNGSESVKVYATTSHGRLGSPIEYLQPGGSINVKINIPVSKSGKRELKRVSIRYYIPGTTHASRLTLYVYYLPCPIIRGRVGETSCTVEDDNGNIKSAVMPITPRLEGDRLMVPLRFIVESCDGKVLWNPTTKTATIDLPGRTATFTANSRDTLVNGFSETLYRNSKITSDHMMVSARSLADVMGADIEFENGNFTITYPGK